MSKFKFNGYDNNSHEAHAIGMDDAILSASENSYNETVSKIVDVSEKQLNRQEANKQKIRKIFIIFFACLLSFQFLALIVFLALRASIPSFYLSDTLFTSYIVSVFVETLGVVSVMVKFAFDAKQEVEILSTLNGVVENFQKYKRNEK